MSIKAREESYALDGSLGRIHRRSDNRGGWWLDGDVVTAWGIVSVTAEERHSRYDFAWNGRHWIRSESRPRTKRGLAIEATKFARRIANQHFPLLEKRRS